MKKISVVSFIVLILTSGCGRFDSSPQTAHFQESRISFNPASLLDKGQIGLMQPHILQDKKGILYAVWINGKTTFLSRSFDNGKRWEKQALTSGMQRSYDWWPFCFSSGSQESLHLVQTSDGIFFSYSKDKGEKWIGPIQVNDDRRKFAYCRNPSFTVDDEGTIGIVYTKKKKPEEIDPWKKEEKSSLSGLYLSKSFDGGNSWSRSILLKDIPYTEPIDFPSLLSYKDILYLAYSNLIYKSIDKGKNWKRILVLKSEFGNIKPIIQTDLHGKLYVIWQKAIITEENTGFAEGRVEGYVDICFSKSTNQGRRWTHPVCINDIKFPFEWEMAPFGVTGTEFVRKYATQEAKEARPFDLAVSEDGKIIGVVWKDWRNGKGELYFSYSLDGGKSWSKNVRVNDDFAQEIKAGSLAIKEDGLVYILWTNLGPHKPIPAGFVGNVEVYFSSGNIED